jgi:hypothetical protein
MTRRTTATTTRTSPDGAGALRATVGRVVTTATTTRTSPDGVGGLLEMGVPAAVVVAVVAMTIPTPHAVAGALRATVGRVVMARCPTPNAGRTCHGAVGGRPVAAAQAETIWIAGWRTSPDRVVGSLAHNADGSSTPFAPPSDRSWALNRTLPSEVR